MNYSFVEELSPKIFYNNVIPYLKSDIIKNNIIINLLEDAKKLTNTTDWLFANVRQNKITEIILIVNDSGRMFLYSPTNNIKMSLYQYLTNVLQLKNKKIKVIEGEPSIANLFAKTYTKITNKKINNIMNINGLVLDKLNKIDTKGLNIRRATKRDHGIMKLNEKNRYYDIFKKVPTDKEIKKYVDNSLKSGTYFLIKDDEIVSQAIHKRAISIGGVYTPKEHRGKGYATICTFLLAKKLIGNGNKKLVIYTDQKDRVTNYIYEKTGFKHKFDLVNITLD